MQERTIWNRTADTGRNVRANRTAARIHERRHVSIHPIQWVLEYPVALATVLLCFAILVYLLQVNQATWLEFNLNQAGVDGSKINAVNAHLLAQKDALLAESRIDSIATTKLHMQHPSLSTAIWVHVRVPAYTPKEARPPVVKTGPLDWMEHTITSVGDSL